MKLSNIFKKSTASSTKSKIEKIEKTQLEKVVGGTTVITATTSDRMHSDITISK